MTLLKVPYLQAKDVFELYQPDKAFAEFATDTMTPSEFIETTTQLARFSDVILYLAHALPVREAVWWAACCSASLNHWSDDEANAIRAAKAWVHTPDETSRRHAEKMAEQAGLESGAGWAAMAAFWSGGSITKPGEPAVPPAQYLYAQAVAGSISLTATLPKEGDAQKRYQTFIERGGDIANGGNGLLAAP
ncbi:DUF6931 family protein [Veronia pacifica]|uniref:Twin-arginine translocation pathway signal n=1 Tax=Veronia pacifica TaxID=1080227 RepID=A0A1C3EDQ1_9GAMM|nr:Twin-arginine translocation pathway signal [Veronia pacifica]ODA31358.1 Twin-arginine translocation pathway signal [Veronia pacifica]